MRTPGISEQLIAPVGLGVLAATAAAWYLTWMSSDSLMSLVMMPPAMLSPGEFAVFFALMTTMMVAMMLPGVLPMITAHRLMIRRRADNDVASTAKGTAAFVVPYFLLWGGFGMLSLSGLVVLKLVGPMAGAASFAPAAVLVGAGVYQFTRAKEACLQECQSPFSFILRHWRDGDLGAVRMGLSHASYCLGCCWLFMIALFVTGTMSLLWMGAISLAIFIEKVGFNGSLVSKVIGVLLLVLGVVVVLEATLTM